MIVLVFAFFVNYNLLHLLGSLDYKWMLRLRNYCCYVFSKFLSYEQFPQGMNCRSCFWNSYQRIPKWILRSVATINACGVWFSLFEGTASCSEGNIYDIGWWMCCIRCWNKQWCAFMLFRYRNILSINMWTRFTIALFSTWESFVLRGAIIWGLTSCAATGDYRHSLFATFYNTNSVWLTWN